MKVYFKGYHTIEVSHDYIISKNYMGFETVSCYFRNNKGQFITGKEYIEKSGNKDE